MSDELRNVVEVQTTHLRKVSLKFSPGYEVPRVEDGVSYSDFFERFLFNNQPCIVKYSGINSWHSYNKWVSNGKLDFTYLKDTYGHKEVPVADCGEKYFNVHKKSTLLFSDFLKYWEDYIIKSHTNDLPCLYLKDWHFTQDFPQHQVYRVPHYFASDWLNEYFSSKTNILDDYRFVYMGPKGSWTPLHADVFMSFSWSMNICGRKRWLLFPPGQEDHLCDRFGKLAYDTTLPEMLDEALFPNYGQLKASYEVIQEVGEAIFVPSGWHHQVWNLEDTISINHNWVNGCNIEAMLKSLQANLAAVKREVEDCRDMEDWEEHCQLILRASYGIDYEEFYAFLKYIISNRLKSFPVTVYGGWTLGKNHIHFDLKQLANVLRTFATDCDTVKLKFFKNISNDLHNLVEEIDSVISNH